MSGYEPPAQEPPTPTVELTVTLGELSSTLDTLAVHLWRGDLLWAMALSDEAAIAYQLALEQAEASGDKESQARAPEGLPGH